MSARDTSGSAPQHSHPHNNTMSRNEKFWVDQVTVPHPPLGNDKGWGTTRGGGYHVCIHYLYLPLPPGVPPQQFRGACAIWGVGMRENGGGQQGRKGMIPSSFRGPTSHDSPLGVYYKWRGIQSPAPTQIFIFTPSKRAQPAHVPDHGWMGSHRQLGGGVGLADGAAGITGAWTVSLWVARARQQGLSKQHQRGLEVCCGKMPVYRGATVWDIQWKVRGQAWPQHTAPLAGCQVALPCLVGAHTTACLNVQQKGFCGLVGH